MAGATTPIAAGTLVQEERAGAVMTLRLNRAEKLNALSTEMAQALLAGLLRAEDDPTVRAVIITGAGRAFCSGGDLHEIREARIRRAPEDLRPFLVAGKEICLAITSMPKLVIAGVNGPAFGGGMCLALACDLRTASSEAVFAQSFAQIGLLPDFGATYFLPRLVGWSRATELFYTAETLSASEACRIGIACRVFAAEKFEEETQKLAQHLAAGPPLAYRDVKRKMIGDNRLQIETALDEEIRLQLHAFMTEDCAEGLAAFFEKRLPQFRGH